MQDKGLNILVYPRGYNLRGKQELHSVSGVLQDGTEVNIKLRVDPVILESHKNNPESQHLIPSVKEFSRTDRKAKLACVATDSNSPEKREGVLLFSKAFKEEGKDNRYIAEWAAVLSEDSSSPDPIYGIGRMEVNRNTTAVRRIKSSLRKAMSDGSPDEIKQLEDDMGNPKNFTFRAVIYVWEEIFSVEPKDMESNMGFISSYIDRHTVKGKQGGVVIRAVDIDNCIYEKRCYELIPRWLVDEQRVQTGEESIDEFWEKYKYEIMDDKTIKSFDIIPTQRINCGPRGNQYHGEPDRYRNIMKTFYDSKGERSLCSSVAIRVWESPEEENTLLTRIYATTAPLGSYLKITDKGTFDTLFVSERARLEKERADAEMQMAETSASEELGDDLAKGDEVSGDKDKASEDNVADFNATDDGPSSMVEKDEARVGADTDDQESSIGNKGESPGSGGMAGFLKSMMSDKE